MIQPLFACLNLNYPSVLSRRGTKNDLYILRSTSTYDLLTSKLFVDFQV